MRLRDKVAIVFGAGPNIGGTIALMLARSGVAVVVSDLDAATAEGTAVRIRSEGSMRAPSAATHSTNGTSRASSR